MLARLMGLKTISPDALYRLAQSPEPVAVIDVNSRQSWMQAHVPGARNLDPAAYAESDLPADKNAPLVFYCSNPMCMKAPNAARRPRSSATATFRSCRRESAAGSRRSCPRNREAEDARKLS